MSHHPFPPSADAWDAIFVVLSTSPHLYCKDKTKLARALLLTLIGVRPQILLPTQAGELNE